MTNKFNNLLISTFSVLGIICISSGLVMPNLVKFEKTEVGKLQVSQRKVTNAKNNEIKLNDLTFEVNTSISTNVRDYLLNPDNIEDSIIERLKLDTSNVNINTVGTYIYTITFNKKLYNGNIIIKQKELPNIDSMTLNSLSFEVNTKLPTDIAAYIKETLSDEVKAGIKIDTSNVDITKAGSYLYSVSYNGKFYTNTITIYEPKSGEITTNNEKTKEDN